VGIETLPTVFFQASSLRMFLICSFIAGSGRVGQESELLDFVEVLESNWRVAEVYWRKASGRAPFAFVR
ncbi:hypothetical protein, partial [Pseudomonas aeruginosa]|uniref:hypothetical protein n=1 Tax=Pseudomonas aeruginosa TaxID=287 RepID=UPI003968CD0F